MAQTKQEPTHDHIDTAAAVYGDELDDHLKKPWAMVARVLGETNYPDGEPTFGDGDAIVRLVNGSAHSVPEAMINCPPINLALAHPYLPLAKRSEVEVLGGIMLESRTARALGEALIRAADITDRQA